jgi:hypothetical protein
MHVLRGVFLAYSSERGALQRAVPRYQLKALETGPPIDPVFLSQKFASYAILRSIALATSILCKAAAVQPGTQAAAIRTSPARFVNTQTFQHSEQNANISNNCLFPC